MSSDTHERTASAGSAPNTRIIFLHHSVGADLLKDGNVRGLLRQQAPGVELWDQAYNPPRLRRIVKSLVTRQALMPAHYYGLRDGTSRRVPSLFTVPRDNTDPDGLAALFEQPVTNQPTTAFSHLLHFDVVAFKSCFVIFPIVSEEQLDRYKAYYLRVGDVMGKHPDAVFVPMTPPPLRAGLATAEQADRSRRFARWMMSEEFHGGRPNVVPFDLFDRLATPEGAAQANMLRAEYCRADTGDTHPNALAGQRVAEQWVPVLASAAERARQVSTLPVAW